MRPRVGMAVIMLCAACSSSGYRRPDDHRASSAIGLGRVRHRCSGPLRRVRQAADRPGDQSTTDIEVDGTSRWYLLNTPSPTTPSPTPPRRSAAEPGTPIPRPLVVDFHGLSEGAVIHSATTMFGALGQKDGFVAVFPNGTGHPGRSGRPRPPPTPIPTSSSSPPCSTSWSPSSASTRPASTPAGSPTARSWSPSWPAPCRTASPPSPPSRVWCSPSRADRPAVFLSSPSTAPPTRSCSSTAGSGPRTLNRVLGHGGSSSSSRPRPPRCR